MDLAPTISECWTALNATGSADAVFWDAAELHTFADEEVKRLAREAPAFVEVDASVATVAGTGRYPLPVRHVDTVEVSIGGVNLRASGVDEWAAGDGQYAARQGALPSHYAQDEVGSAHVSLYPVPSAAVGAIRVLHAQYPTELVPGSANVTTPEVMRELFLFATLAGARSKESPGAMPDVAEWCAAQAAMLRGVAAEVWA